MLPRDRCHAVRLGLTLALLCLNLSPKVFAEEINETENETNVTQVETEDQEVVASSEVQDEKEARGLWESDLFFLQKLSGIFGGGEERVKAPPRQGSLRPEPLPPQLYFNPTRRQSASINKYRPSLKPGNSEAPTQHVPYFQLPFGRPTPKPNRPKKRPQGIPSSPAPSNSFIAVHLPPPPPPPSPPSSLVTAPSAATPGGRFPYTFLRPGGVTPSLKPPARVDRPPLVSSNQKPEQVKTAKPKKPSFLEGIFGGLDLTGSASVAHQAARPNLPVRTRPQQLHHFPPRSQSLKPQNSPAKPKPQTPRPHPRPAPKPQKQHPRPPPQPQRIDFHGHKPTAFHKKPVVPDFKPSPKEGSVLADAFQPVFVASPSMDDLGNDIMKPMHFASARSSPTSSTAPPLEVQDFFE